MRGPVGLLLHGSTVAASQRDAVTHWRPPLFLDSCEFRRQTRIYSRTVAASQRTCRRRGTARKRPCSKEALRRLHSAAGIQDRKNTGGPRRRRGSVQLRAFPPGGASSGGRGEEAAGGAQVLGAAGEGGQRRVEVLANQGLAEEEAARTAGAGGGQARDEEEVGDAGLGPAQEPAADHAAQEVAQGWDLCAAMRARVGRLRACMGLSGMSSR